LLPAFTKEPILPDTVVESSIQQACRIIDEAEYLLIAAGAGMSTDAGIDYTDTKQFGDIFPSLAKQGFRCRYDLTGYDGWDLETKWGYVALCAYHDFFSTEGDSGYLQLLQIAEQKDYFVVTSNVDGMFYRNHFKADKICLVLK